jgi:hypothetical protein
MRYAIGITIALAITCAAPARARAQPLEKVHIAYGVAADADCPDAASYRARITARNRGVSFVDRADAGRVFDVQVRADPDGQMHGRLAVRDSAGLQTVREVFGATCAEVIDALALVAALALDPQQPQQPQQPRAAPAPVPPATPSTARPRVGFGASAGGIYDAVPGVGPAGGAFVDVRTRLVRVSISGAVARGSASVGAANAAFTRVVGRVDLCRDVLDGPVRWAGCVRAEAGVLSGVGANIEDPVRVRRPWLAPGLGLTGTKGLFGRLFGRLAFSLTVPLIRDRFLFSPDTTVHRAGVVVPELMIGVGGWFL